MMWLSIPSIMYLRTRIKEHELRDKRLHVRNGGVLGVQN